MENKIDENFKQDSLLDNIELDISKAELDDNEEGLPEYHINTYPTDFTLEVLYHKWKKNLFIIPEFQREFVWTKNQASKLIESFICGLPVPAIFLFRESETNKFIVIDGQQRLKSIFYYFEGFFGEESNGKKTIFNLTGLNKKSKYFEKDINQLEDSDKLKLEDTVLRAFVVDPSKSTDDEDTSIYHIFERLNTGGTKLASQEIRNCVYHGKFNDMLKQLNKYDNWRKILGKKISDKRQRDAELILRFYSMFKIENYSAPLKEHLSNYMKKHKNLSEVLKKDMESIFKTTCDNIITHLGEKPFHIKSGVNTAVLESVMVAFAKNKDSNAVDISKKYAKLLDDKTFQDSITGPLTNADLVRDRFSQAEVILFG